jgi:hypothetical protein
MWENVQINELVTNNTTTHLRKVILIVAFDRSMWIIMISQMGVSCIVDSIAGKKGFLSQQNVTSHMGLRINPTAKFQLATHVQRFNMLNVLDVVWLHSFCV